jgi:hypothetical protein
VELETTRRMLGLVEATVQQVEAQGQAAVHEDGPQHVPGEAGTEVRILSEDTHHRSIDVTCVSLLRQATLADVLKRSRPPSLGVEPQPQSLPTRALPTALWEDHLLPLLTCKDAARLGCTCKALRGVVREHFKDLGDIKLNRLQPALTTFPRATSLAPHCPRAGSWGDAESEALMEWLREGGRGAGITTMTTSSCDHLVPGVIHTALRGGALPSLTAVDVRVSKETHRAFMTEGLVGGMHELRLMVVSRREMAPELAALGLVRQLPPLATLELEIDGCSSDDEEEANQVEWPPFIPPSLKTLRLRWWSRKGSAAEPLLRALPGMLGASGARVERLEVTIPSAHDELGDGLVHVAQVLRHCSPTLKHLRLRAWDSEGICVGKGDGEYDEVQVDQLREQWAGVLAGVSACRELQALVLPYIEVETVFPPGTAFARLTHLEISDCERDHPPFAGVITLWEVMASGGLPALAHFTLQLEGYWGVS